MNTMKNDGPDNRSPAPSVKSDAYTVLDLFSGCGGLSSGFIQAGGYEVVGACQWDRSHPSIAKTYEANHPGTIMVDADIRLPETKRRLCDLFAGRHCSVVVGGVPCIAYSTSGNRDVNDPRGMLWKDHLEIVGLLRPDVAVIENVVGIMSPRKGEEIPVVDRITAEFRHMGYSVEHRVLNAADLGVPQRRKRVIIIATRLDIPIRFPEPTHSKDVMHDEKRLPWVSVREAIGNLEDAPEDGDLNHVHIRSSPAFIERIRATPIGKSAAVNYVESYVRTPPDEPAVTVKAHDSGVLVHYSKDRLMTPRELARLQTFPDSFRFQGRRSEVLLMIGNAVPIGLSRAVATSVRGMLEEARGAASAVTSSSVELDGSSAMPETGMPAMNIPDDANRKTTPATAVVPILPISTISTTNKTNGGNMKTRTKEDKVRITDEQVADNPYKLTGEQQDVTNRYVGLITRTANPEVRDWTARGRLITDYLDAMRKAGYKRMNYHVILAAHADCP